MIPGLNHNIRYRDRVFHVQTEDSGLIRRQLTTHVFLDGSVVAYERTTYPEAIAAVSDEALRNNEIRKLMQNQHRSLLKRLVAGSFDEALVRLGIIPPAELPPAPQPEKEVRQILNSLPAESSRTVPNPPAASMKPSIPANLPTPPALEPRRSEPLRKQSELKRPVPADMAPTADVIRSPVSASRASDRFNPDRTLIDEPTTDRSRQSLQPWGESRPGSEARTAPRVEEKPRSDRPLSRPSDPRPQWPSSSGSGERPRSQPDQGQRPTTSDPALRAPRPVPGVPRPGVFTDRPAPTIPPHQAASFGRTLIDSPPLFPPKAPEPKRVDPEPRPGSRAPRTVSAPSRPLSIHDERTLVEPKKPVAPRAPDLEHDTLLDFQSPFSTRVIPDPLERRTDPPSSPNNRTSRDQPAGRGRSQPGKPQDPSAAVTLRDMPTGLARSMAKRPPHPTPLPLLEDPTMDEGLIGLQANDDQVLDVLDPNEVISGLDEHSEETDPLRNSPAWRSPSAPVRPQSQGRLAAYPTPSTPPLAGASWLDQADLGAGSMPQSARGEPGRRPWAQGDPFPTGGPPNAFAPGTTPTPPTGEQEGWEPPDLPTLEPQPVWPPPDADLDQFVREQAQLLPEPLSPHEPIRVEDRSLDDIILGYLSHKKG